MATNNFPKHDFAPAWLKIPSQENSKPTGSKQADQQADKANRNRKDDSLHTGNINAGRYGPDYSRLHRQHSFETYYEGSKRFPSGQGGKFRHHSVDDDYYAAYYGPYGYYNGYSAYEKYGMHYSSQPALFPSRPRDSKYQHPNARFAGQPLNGGYPNYYDINPYDYYGADPYYGYSLTRGASGTAKRGYYEKEGRSNSKEGKDKDGEKKEKDEKEKPFNEDFPSLNGGLEEQSTKGSSNQVNGTGVWDNPPIGKGGNSLKLDDSSDASQSKGGANIYKALVPNKSSIPRRPNREGLRLNGSYRDQGPFSTGNKPPTPTGGFGSPFSKEGSRQSPTPPMDILNTRFVTQPKTLGDKKSQFLKALRKETNTGKAGGGKSESSDRKSTEGDLVNGVDNLDLGDEDSAILSSSLEAEQRLLREMGWNEADEEEYEITEDDRKEFQSKSKQIQEQQPMRNGLVRTIPKTWSPKHIPIYQPNMQELNETLSSSDSDSDDSVCG